MSIKTAIEKILNENNSQRRGRKAVTNMRGQERVKLKGELNPRVLGKYQA
jgi:uncharacterized protein YdcH (DUF465 family)